MDELVWINGRVLPMSEATIAVEDRGFQFADGVYEVIRLYDGRPFRLAAHLQRLAASASGILLHLPMGQQSLSTEILRLIEQTDARDGMVYLQLTRGSSARNHLFPDPEVTPPTLLFYTRPLPVVPPPGHAPGVRLLAMDDFRWKRCWIKCIALIPNVLAKNAAIEAGADEAVFIENGVVTECSVSSFFAVQGNTVVTHPVGPKVLPGITMQVVREVAAEIGVGWDERPLLEAEALAADELFITSTTREIGWVSEWNRRPIARGRCGPVTLRLHEALVQKVREETASPAVLCATHQ